MFSWGAFRDHSYVDRDGGQGLLAFRDGFWLDKDGNYTEKRMEFKYWIPPHQIEMIEVLDEEEKHEA
jgi:hypothetical protein